MSHLQREDLIGALPYARRYARALTGGQEAGDGLVAASLREMLAANTVDADARIALYESVTRRFNAQKGERGNDGGLTRLQRQLLLLTTLEEIVLADAAMICGVEGSEACPDHRG
jgi:hypothetical protein